MLLQCNTISFLNWCQVGLCHAVALHIHIFSGKGTLSSCQYTWGKVFYVQLAVAVVNHQKEKDKALLGGFVVHARKRNKFIPSSFLPYQNRAKKEYDFVEMQDFLKNSGNLFIKRTASRYNAQETPCLTLWLKSSTGTKESNKLALKRSWTISWFPAE